MTHATFSHRPPMLPVTRLRLGRAMLLLGLTVVGLLGGTIWLLTTKAHPIALPTLDSTAWPAWLKQTQVYPAPEVKPAPPPAPPAPDLTAAQLAALRAQLEEQRQAIEALKARLAQRGPAAAPPPPPTTQAASAPKKAPAPMLFVGHDAPAAPPPHKATEYTLAPGATKLPCIIETAMNSDVEGYFTAKVSTNVYDTATGRHLLVPQGSTILGHDQSSTLLYGNERLPTISLTSRCPMGGRWTWRKRP